MKLSKLLIFCILFNLTFLIAKGQVKLASFDEFSEFKGMGLSGYLSLNVLDSNKSLDTLCLRGCLFIKFNISIDGEVVNIAGNLGANKNLVDSFKRALLSTNGRWSPHMVNGSAIESPYFLLPIYVHLRSCKYEELKEDSFFENFTNSYQFEDNTTIENQICIILKPAMIVALH